MDEEEDQGLICRVCGASNAHPARLGIRRLSKVVVEVVVRPVCADCRAVLFADAIEPRRALRKTW